MNRDQFILSLLALTSFVGLSFGAQVAELDVGRGKAAVVYPEHYVKDPGAGFPLVLLTDVAEASAEVQAFADAYRGAVFVCAGQADRTKLLAELAKNPRLFSFPRGRIEIPSMELAAADVVTKLKTYFKCGRYQAMPPKVTRYGARIYRAERTDSADPTMTVSAPWKVIEGDPGETGCDARLAYFTVEADGENLPAPTVTVSWPGVKIASVDGARDVRMTDDGVMLTPTDSSGGTNYLTIVREGAIELALHHHVEGAQHGPYVRRPLPWAQIRASDNWRAALRAAFKDAGIDSFAATDGAAINLYGFDSNFPRRHVDYPEHFHVMLMWDDWKRNNVGHYTLDEKGFIRGNNFLVCGNIAGGLSSGYHPQPAGLTTEYVGPRGRVCFSLEMQADGKGLVLRKPGTDVAWLLRAERPDEAVALSYRADDKSPWATLGAYSVLDDTERGTYVISCTNAAGVSRTTVIRYQRDTGALLAVEESSDFGDARWLWPAELGVATNTVVEFRQVFSSDGTSPARLAIAADTVYHVELNGRAVYWGRFPDVPPRRFYDVLPLGDLRPGENVLKVSVYAQGADSFQTLPGDHGVMFAVVGEGVRAASGTNAMWRISSGDRREGVPMVTSQLGYSFDFDASRPPAEWKRIGVADAKRDVRAFSMRERPVPRVEILSAIASRVVCQGRLDGSPVPEDVAPGMDATRMSEMPKGEFFAGDGRSVRRDNFKDGFYVLVDLGREECGFLTLDVDTDAGAVIDIGHAEHAENGRIRTSIKSRRFAGRYRARDGRQTYCRWAKRMAGRYIQLHVRGVRTRFALNGVSILPAVFPVRERPAPGGLDPKEKAIWDVGVRTLRLCMHEHYEDCPWREQALYANDSRIQMLAGYFAFDPGCKMPELAIELLSMGLDEKGWIELCMPARIGLAIPSFTFSWVLALGDYLTYRNNPAFVESMMPPLRTIMDAREGELVDGLLPCPRGKRYWQFYDWEKDLSGSLSNALAGVDDAVADQFDAPLNLFAVLAFESAARCAVAVRDDETAARWLRSADRIRLAVRRKFWNGEKGEIETRLGASLAPAELSQSLALLADAIPRERRADVVRKLSAPSDWTKTSLSQSLYKFEALRIAGGEAERAMRKEMEETWSAMLDAGATSFWEVSDGWRAFGNAGSLCHGWSAVPVYFYGSSGN